MQDTWIILKPLTHLIIIWESITCKVIMRRKAIINTGRIAIIEIKLRCLNLRIWEVAYWIKNKITGSWCVTYELYVSIRLWWYLTITKESTSQQAIYSL